MDGIASLGEGPNEQKRAIPCQIRGGARTRGEVSQRAFLEHLLGRRTREGGRAMHIFVGHKTGGACRTLEKKSAGNRGEEQPTK